MGYSCIIRSGPLQLLSSSPPVDCNSTSILLADNSFYIVQPQRVINGNAQVVQLNQGDPRRVSDNVKSSPAQPIFDISKVGEGMWRISSHNSDKVVTSRGGNINLSGQTGVQFGRGNVQNITLTE